jgi:molybdopterin synthase sulfur carrier subunit
MPLIKLYANLRNLAGTKEVSIPESTIRAALNELVRQNPPLGDVILDNGGLRPHVLIVLNGHNVVDLNIHVNEQDIVAIFPPIAGG